MEFQQSSSKPWKRMLWKCCTQYVRKYGKSSSDHRTGKGQSPSQFPRRAELKNVQTTRQLYSFPMVIKLCSKSSKLGFSITWTENFQMSKLGLEKAEEPVIKWPTSVGSSKKQENSRKKICFIDYTKAFDCRSQNTVENSSQDGNTRPLDLSP